MKSYAAYDDHMLEKGCLQCSPAPDETRPDPLGQESKIEDCCKLKRTLQRTDQLVEWLTGELVDWFSC